MELLIIHSQFLQIFCQCIRELTALFANLRARMCEIDAQIGEIALIAQIGIFDHWNVEWDRDAEYWDHHGVVFFVWKYLIIIYI